jgi:hypothetical protein
LYSCCVPEVQIAFSFRLTSESDKNISQYIVQIVNKIDPKSTLIPLLHLPMLTYIWSKNNQNVVVAGGRLEQKKKWQYGHVMDFDQVSLITYHLNLLNGCPHKQ